MVPPSLPHHLLTETELWADTTVEEESLVHDSMQAAHRADALVPPSSFTGVGREARERFGAGRRSLTATGRPHPLAVALVNTVDCALAHPRLPIAVPAQVHDPIGSVLLGDDHGHRQ